MSGAKPWMVAAIAASAVYAGMAAPLFAQAFPSKPLRVVVGFPPGGGADLVARLVALKVGEALKQQIVEANRAGANGIIASEFRPCRWTACAASSHSPGRDLVSSPYASAGTGNVTHLAGQLFKSMTEIRITHVPYKGSAPAIVDLMAGQVMMYSDTMPSPLPHVRAGKLNGLAITSMKRSAGAPGIPTVAESGVPGFETTSWFGLLAPAGTPQAAVDTLHRETIKALGTADGLERMRSQGPDSVLNTPAEFATVIRTDIDKWARVIKGANIQVQ